MVKGASFSAGFSTPSTSSPIRVSVPTISSTVAFVSRWSFSHERVNFMRPLPPTALAHPAQIGVEERSEEHTSELQSLMRISYAVFCLTKKKKHSTNKPTRNSTHTQT